MKIEWNKKYTTVAVYSLIVLVIAVLFVVFVFKFDSFAQGLSWVGAVAAPIVAGIVIAYIFNPLMTVIEEKVFKKLKYSQPKENSVMKKLQDSPVGENVVVKQLERRAPSVEKKIGRRKKAARVLSLILTYLLFLTAIAGICIAVVPNVAGSVVELADHMDVYVEQVENFVNNMFEDNPGITKFISEEFTSFRQLVDKLAEALKPMAGDIIGNVGSGLFKFIGGVLVGLKNVVIGLVIAIYLLYSKERLLAQCKKILYAFIKTERCEAFFSGCKKSNGIFKKYVISNLVDSMIVFVCMVIGMFAMGMPYQMLIATVCAVTNLIPFFGPFIGAIPCGLLILLADPSKVIWFAVFVLVLQQIDGNVIKPFLFGETMGLPAIWVLVSIIVGGGLFGVPGMLLGAPVFAVFYLLFSEFIAGRLKKKKLPEETEVYTCTTEQFAEDYIDKPKNETETTPEPTENHRK